MTLASTHPLVDQDALAHAQVHAEPYRWAYLRQALHAEHAATLRATFPTTGFWRLTNHDGEKFMQFKVRAIVPLGAQRAVLTESLHPAWRALAEELLSPAYRAASARAFGLPLGEARLEVSAWRWGPEAVLGPHLDLPRKIASQVFYFNDEWDPAWGGCLRILRSEDPQDTVAELEPTLGSASLVVRSEKSWHCVPPVGPGSPERLSVVATWQHSGSESPFWTVDPDGSVRCHARGSTPDDKGT